MNRDAGDAAACALGAALAAADLPSAPHRVLASLAEHGLDRLPWPGAGDTLGRWRALALVAEHDLALAKLYEGHTDALAILHELRDAGEFEAGAIWGTWAAESARHRVSIELDAAGLLRLRGCKSWCSGAATVSHGLLTAWQGDSTEPQLVRVAMAQPGVKVSAAAWKAVGMAASASIEVTFDGALAQPVGRPGDYLRRPGFWQGGAGVAACWYGGARLLASTLRRSMVQSAAPARSPFGLAALGRIDVALLRTAAVLREAAAWIDRHPLEDARLIAWQARLAAEDCARQVLDEAGRALGPAAFCHDARFARAAADLPVFVRQSHGERDLAALGERVLASDEVPWTL